MKPLYFINWGLTHDGRKVPLSPYTGEMINAHDDSQWVDYDTAKATGRPVALVITPKSDLVFIDLDKCIENGQFTSQAAADIYNLCQGAAIEYSQSGKGMHIFGRITEDLEHTCKNTALNIEMYTNARFAALTEKWLPGGSIDFELTDLVKQNLIPRYWEPNDSVDAGVDWVDEPVPDWHGPVDDLVLIDKMMNAKASADAMFGNGVTFKQLWSNDVPALAAKWPAIGEGKPYDQSSADMSLAMTLAFWTGKNPVRMERIMRMSGLTRDKWDKHRGYLKKTISGAISKQVKVYTNGQKSPVAEAMAAEIKHGAMVGANQLNDYFDGFVHLQQLNMAWEAKTGHLYKPENFKSSFGGHTFVITPDGSKTTRNAWEAFTENQIVRFPRAWTMCFRPEQKAGAILDVGGMTAINTYIPIEQPRKQGDPGPFLDLLRKLAPTEREFQILLAYMASLVQYKGIKFQWALALQGIEGNGKTTLARIIRYCLGDRYCHMPTAGNLGDGGLKFNGWIAQCLFAAFEEIHVSERRDLTDGIKPMISNETIEIQFKGKDQYTGDNRCNFMAFSNYKDALMTHEGDRRWCIIYCNQQSLDDLIKWGMDDEYFNWIYGWLRGNDGFAITHDFLANYEIPYELDPTKGAVRAPRTSSSVEAVELSLGTVEQEVCEAIDQETQGFRKDWVSSMALDQLLDDRGLSRRVPRNKRRDMMRKLGFDYHPGLNKGRVNQTVIQEKGKPRLYIKRGHDTTNWTSPKEILDRYMADQDYVLNLPHSES